MIAMRVVDNTKLADMRKNLAEWKAGSMAGPVGSIRKAWLFQYGVFVRRRFNTYSRGGGDWPPLKPETIRNRTRGGTRGRGGKGRTKNGRTFVTKLSGTGGVSILKDTGVLFGGLSLDSPGNAAHGIPSGIAFGFTSAAHKGGASIATIARAHDSGAGHLPRRRILAKPDKATTDRMVKTFTSTLAKASRQTRSTRITGPGV